MFEKTKEFSDDKVQLAMQTYEMVDKHIRRLDSELVKLEAELKDKQISSATGSGAGEEGKKKSRAANRDKKGSSFNPKNVIKEDTEKKKAPVELTQVSASEHVLAALAGSSEGTFTSLTSKCDPVCLSRPIILIDELALTQECTAPFHFASIHLFLSHASSFALVCTAMDQFSTCPSIQMNQPTA